MSKPSSPIRVQKYRRFVPCTSREVQSQLSLVCHSSEAQSLILPRFAFPVALTCHTVICPSGAANRHWGFAITVPRKPRLALPFHCRTNYPWDCHPSAAQLYLGLSLRCCIIISGIATPGYSPTGQPKVNLPVYSAFRDPKSTFQGTRYLAGEAFQVLSVTKRRRLIFACI
jgi:hypothetical protein